MKKVKPVLYLDVDGVLFYYQDKAPYACLSSHVSDFFYQVIRGQFELRMLTANEPGGQAILDTLYNSGTSYCFTPGHVPFVYGKDGFRNALIRQSFQHNKISFIDFDRPFLWIEDGISPAEEDILKEKNLLGNYYFVDAFNPEGLKNAMIWMMGHELFEAHEDTKNNPAWAAHPQCASVSHTKKNQGGIFG